MAYVTDNAIASTYLQLSKAKLDMFFTVAFDSRRQSL